MRGLAPITLARSPPHRQLGRLGVSPATLSGRLALFG